MAKFEPKPFGKYFLTERIAIGGMAEIYKAKTFGVDGFEKVLAIKKILSHFSADKEFITMLTDEAKLVVNLSHANIVQVYDLGRVDDDYFISMEFIEGINLRDLVEKAKELGESIPEELCIYIASEICKGLDYAHNKRDDKGKPLEIVHRDVSPQNILVSYDGGVKIVDFGIAKATRNLSQTHVGTLKGKVTYMSPEQAFGKPIDGRTDLFSLGIVLNEIITQKRLFTGESQMEVLKKIRNTTVTEESLDAVIPKSVRPIIAKALAYKAADRFQSAADMQIELTKVLYSQYPDFSPRKLTDILHNWFPLAYSHLEGGSEQEEQGEEPKEAILVSSVTQEISADVLDKTSNASLIQNFAETIKPSDKITRQQFLDAEEGEFTENTEKSDLEEIPSASVDELLLQKRKRRKFYRLLVLFFVLITVVLVMFYQNQDKENDAAPTPVVKTDEVVDETVVKPDQVTKVPVELVVRDILLKTTPPGAKVFLNGQDLQAVTPHNLKKIKIDQNYELRFVKTGYVDLIKKIEITKESEAEIGFLLDPALIKLSITSSPEGAAIWLDGKDTGHVTPYDLSELRVEQSYQVEIKKDEFKNSTQSWVTTKNEDQELSIKLDPVDKGSVVVTSKPVGAKIIWDGKDTGFVTPHEFKDLPLLKELDVQLKLKGFTDFSQKLTPKDSTQMTLSPDLVKIKVEEKKIVTVPIRVSANLAGATVLIDGVSKGKTPLKLSVSPGYHRIYVKKTGYKSSSKKVTVRESKKRKSYYFKLTTTAEKVVPTPTTTKPTTTTRPAPDIVKTSTKNVSKTGKLRVDSSPRGASVKVNGVSKGITPLMVTGLQKNKSLSVTVSKSGYRTWSRSIRLSKDRTELKANLTR